MKDVTVQLERCLQRFHDGHLKAEDLERAMAAAAAAMAAGELAHGQQSLLYVQTTSTDPYSDIIGMSIYEQGADHQAVDEAGDFLYASIRDAQADGWRIIKFPELALMMHDQLNYGLGYEFVLERQR